MSSSLMPAALTAAVILLMVASFSVCAALAVALLVRTPKSMRAMVGLTVTLPVPVTLTVGTVVVVSALTGCLAPKTGEKAMTAAMATMAMATMAMDCSVTNAKLFFMVYLLYYAIRMCVCFRLASRVSCSLLGRSACPGSSRDP